jgi:hypothetical protein
MTDLLLSLTLSLAAADRIAQTSNSCSSVAIAAARGRLLGQDGAINRYALDITVANLGSRPQPSSMLQSVEIFQDATKVDQKGVPPLRPGQRVTVTYDFTRSVEARPDTTRFRLKLVGHDPHAELGSACQDAAEIYRVTV